MDGLIQLIRRRFSQDALFWLCALTVLLVIPTLLVVAWVAIDSEHVREDRERVTVEQSWERRSAIEGVALLLKDAESSQRGYVITGDASFLRRDRAAAATIDEQLDRLERIFADRPDQLARVRELKGGVAKKFAHMNQVADIRAHGGLEAAATVVRRREGEDLMERLRAITDEMTAVEVLELNESLDNEHHEIDRARRVASLSFGLVLLAIIAAGVMAFRYTLLRTRMITRVRAEADRRQAIFDSTMDAIITLNPSGGIETLNSAAERMFGYRPKDLLGRDISVLVPLAPGDEGLFLDRLGQGELRNGEACSFEARRSDGSTFPVDVNLGEMPQPDGAHIVAVMRDCTERRRAEQAKNEFVSTVSHELRTPLTSIAGSLGLLIGGAAGELPERATRLLGIAESNSRRLVRLINDILDMEKIQSGNMQFSLQSLDLGDLVSRAIDGIGGMAGDLDVRVDYAPPPAPVRVRADADRLTQVLTNLLSNAVKFSPRGAQVEVTVSTEGTAAQVTVRDHGPGIPEEFRDRIFGKFAQADSSDTRQKGGTGLGLAITREIVERQGGRIWFESTPGQGAAFIFQTPLEMAPLPAVMAPAAAGPKLLLCEDDLDVSQVLRDALELQGFQVVVAGSLRETEAALARENFEALLLDLRLPDGNGMDLLRKLRGNPATRALPVIVVSADPHNTAAGAFDLVDWIAKPVDMGRLQVALQQVVGLEGERPVVLHVDDDPDLRHLVVEAFGGRCQLVAADSVAAARRVLATVTPQLVILDVGLPDGSGLDLLPELVDEQGAALPVVIFSAQSLEEAQLTAAVDAVLTKSRTSLGQLTGTVRRLFQARQASLREAPGQEAAQ